MMSADSDDVLARAARALRDQADRDRSVGDAVEAWQGMHGWHEVSRDLRRAARRRRLGLIVGLQVVAALAGLGAWAAASGRLPQLFSRMVAPSRHASAERAAPPRPARARRPIQPAPETAPPPPPAAVATVALPGASRAHPGTSGPRPVAPPSTSLPPVVAPSDPDELYRQAHHEHFVRRDYAAALALWDRYLALDGGALVLEARYNRAIALVRLNRRETARAALAPFAAGQRDGYRQEEARALLRMLEAAPPP